MALDVKGKNELWWKTGLNLSGLRSGATKAVSIIQVMKSKIARINPFAILGIIGTAVFAKLSVEAFKFSNAFDDAMKEVMTISKAVRDSFDGISDAVVRMSEEMPHTAIELTKGLYQIVSAGYDGAEALDILAASSKLATAGLTDVFTAADTLTYVMNAYGIEAGTATDITDKLFTIVRLGKVRMEELAPTISMVTGLAAEAGMKFNDLAAFYAEAVKKIQPHIVTTGIRGFVTALLRASKEGAEAAEAAKKLGIEFDTTTLKTKGLQYMINQMAEATRGQREALMELFPNVRGLIGVLSIMTDEGVDLAKSLNEIENSTGATERAMKTMMTTLGNQAKILKNTILATLKPLGDTILETATFYVTGINRIFAAFRENMEAQRLDRLKEILKPTGEATALQLMEGYRPFKKTIDQRVKEIEKLGIIIPELWNKLWDIYENKLNTAADRQEKMNKLIYEFTVLAKEAQTVVEPTRKKPQEVGIGVPFVLDENFKDYEIYMRRLMASREKIRKEQEKIEKEKAYDLKMEGIIWKKDRVGVETYEERAEDIEKRAKERAKIQIEANRKMFEEMLGNTRGYNAEKLRIYANTFKEQAKLYDIDSDMHRLLLEKYEKVMQEVYDAELKRIAEIGDAFQEIGNFIEMFDTKLGRIVGRISDIATDISKIDTATTKWGAFAGEIGIATTFISVMQSIFEKGESSNKRIIEQMENMNRLTQKQINLLRRMQGLEALGGIVDLHTTLNTQIEKNLKALARLPVFDVSRDKATVLGDLFEIEEALTNLYDLSRKFGVDGGLFLISKETQQTIKALITDIENAQEMILDYQEEYRRLITGTTAASIVDAITDGFEQGLDSAKGFANSFEDMMRQALINSFKRTVMTKFFDSFYKEFALAAGDEEGLTAEDINTLKDTFKTHLKNAAGEWKKISEILEEAGFSMQAPRKGLAGVIGTITETTAGLLAGQFNAMRIEAIKQTGIQTNMLATLVNMNVGKLQGILNATVQTSKNTYWNDDIYNQLVNINDGKLLPSLNALWDIRAGIYSLTNMATGRLDNISNFMLRLTNNSNRVTFIMTPILNKLDDIHEVTIANEENTRAIRATSLLASQILFNQQSPYSQIGDAGAPIGSPLYPY